nr:putative reverse transcriptase domain-containing protein [Tanacetum cinerariifolium]
HEFSVGDYVLLKMSPWKGVVCFGKKGKLAPRFVRPFEIVEKVGHVAYRLDLPEELNGVHDTFHVSNLKKCLADPLKRSRIAIVKVRWNSKRGPGFMWEHEDQMKLKYPYLFSNILCRVDGDDSIRTVAARDRQKSYADKRRKPLEFSVGDYVLLKMSPWKGVVCFGKKGKLAPRFVRPFEIVEKVGHVAYRLDLPEELNGVHDTFHVSNLKKCLADPVLQVPWMRFELMLS